ncbi:MAG: S1C family serine protease, partial [Christensenellales bacterium]
DDKTSGEDYLGTVEYNIVNTSAVGNENLSAVVAGIYNSVVEIKTQTKSSGMFGSTISSGAGSGVLYGFSNDGDYYIITNNHVIEGADTITVVLTDGTEKQATLVGTDADADIAVVCISSSGINKSKFPTVIIPDAGYQVRVGDTAIAIGNPLGSLGGTVTCGIVSALERKIIVDDTIMTLLQTDASINPGNSGGGLFNARGELIGITNSKYASEEIEGLGFAIPVNTAVEVANSLIEYGYVTGRAALGITILDMKSETYMNSFLNSSSIRNDKTLRSLWYNRFNYLGTGLYIYEVTNAESGLESGDKLENVTVDNTVYTVDSEAKLKYVLSLCKPGDKVFVEVHYFEDNTVKVRELWVTLLERTQ